MKPSAEVVLFLGAGVSLPVPAGGPLFAEVRNACADLAGVPIPDDDPNARRQLLLDSVIPEVFLKLFADAGYRLEDALCRAVAGTPGTGPNPVHRLAARILAAGGAVWTTNWDRWIEHAYADHTGRTLDVSGPGLTPAPADPRTRIRQAARHYGYPRLVDVQHAADHAATPGRLAPGGGGVLPRPPAVRGRLRRSRR